MADGHLQLEFETVEIAEKYEAEAQAVLYEGDCMDLLRCIPDA